MNSTTRIGLPQAAAEGAGACSVSVGPTCRRHKSYSGPTARVITAQSNGQGDESFIVAGLKARSICTPAQTRASSHGGWPDRDPSQNVRVPPLPRFRGPGTTATNPSARPRIRTGYPSFAPLRRVGSRPLSSSTQAFNLHNPRAHPNSKSTFFPNKNGQSGCIVRS